MAPNQSSSWPFRARPGAAGPDDEGAEAEIVEGGDLGFVDVVGIVDEAVDHEQGEDADGDVDVKGVAPRVGVGEPAAEGGTEDGGDDDSEGEDCHGGSAFTGGKDSSRMA